MGVDDRQGFRIKEGFALIVLVIGGLIAILWLTNAPKESPLPSDMVSLLQPTIEVESTVGPERTEGEATAWNNARKLTVDGRGWVHVVYQYDYGPGGSDRIRYALSSDGRSWTLEQEWVGRYPAIAADAQDRVYVVHVERTVEGDRLWLRRRASDGGWTTRMLVEAEPRSIFYPTLAAGLNALHVAWESHVAGKHTLYYLALPLEADLETAELAIEEVVSGEQGLYFASIAVDGQGRVYLAWEVEVDPVRHQIDAAVRTDSGGWYVYQDVSAGVENALYPFIDAAPDGRTRVVFVSHGEGLSSAIYTSTYSDGSWKLPQLMVREAESEQPVFSVPILAFPVSENDYVLWGHTVPAGCGTGPLYWSREAGGRWTEPEPLVGSFASFPHIVERPAGTLHLLWTDRKTEELRAFSVKYMRLQMPQVKKHSLSCIRMLPCPYGTFRKFSHSGQTAPLRLLSLQPPRAISFPRSRPSRVSGKASTPRRMDLGADNSTAISIPIRVS